MLTTRQKSIIGLYFLESESELRTLVNKLDNKRMIQHLNYKNNAQILNLTFSS